MLHSKIGINTDISALDDWATAKDKIKIAEDQKINDSYKAFLDDPTPTTAATLQNLIPAYKKKHDLPEGSLKVMEDALREWQKTKFADNTTKQPYKVGQVLPAEKSGDNYITKQVTGYDKDNMPLLKVVGVSKIREGKDTGADVTEKLSARKKWLEEKLNRKLTAEENRSLVIGNDPFQMLGPAGGTPQEAAPKQNIPKEQIMKDAKEAVKKGAPKGAVKKRLLEMGYTEKQLQSSYFNWLK